MAWFGLQETGEIFCKDTEVSIWGGSKESVRISVAEMSNVCVSSADRAGGER